MAEAHISDQEIAILCDVLEGGGASLNAGKRKVLDQLVAKGFVVAAVQESPVQIQTYRKSSTTSRRARRWTKRRLTTLDAAQSEGLRSSGSKAKFAAIRRGDAPRLVAGELLGRRAGILSPLLKPP
jgi:hypothetical protein